MHTPCCVDGADIAFVHFAATQVNGHRRHPLVRFRHRRRSVPVANTMRPSSKACRGGYMERILILPHNPALDEIMVSLVSVLEYEAVVATESDDPAWAIERVAPALVMLDADHPEAGEPALLVPAQHTNTPVLLFSAS